MDPLIFYLICINVVAFLTFVADRFLCLRHPSLDESAANSVILGLIPIAGGAVGALLALFVMGGRRRGHRMNKDNVAWWFIAIIALIAWALVVAGKYGFLPLDAGLSGVFSGWDLERLKVLGIYLGIVNVTTYAVFAWDKRAAVSGAGRIPEGILLGLGLIGGSVGGILAMRVVRHKTRKWYFVWGLPVFLVLDAVLVFFAHLSGLI